MEKIKSHTYENGFNAMYIQAPGTRVYSAVLFVGMGSRFEKKDLRGISRMYANICFQGSKNYPDKQALLSACDDIGFGVRSTVNPEYSMFYFSSTEEQFLLTP